MFSELAEQLLSGDSPEFNDFVCTRRHKRCSEGINVQGENRSIMSEKMSLRLNNIHVASEFSDNENEYCCSLEELIILLIVGTIIMNNNNEHRDSDSHFLNLNMVTPPLRPAAINKSCFANRISEVSKSTLIRLLRVTSKSWMKTVLSRPTTAAKRPKWTRVTANRNISSQIYIYLYTIRIHEIVTCNLQFRVTIPSRLFPFQLINETPLEPGAMVKNNFGSCNWEEWRKYFN